MSEWISVKDLLPEEEERTIYTEALMQTEIVHNRYLVICNYGIDSEIIISSFIKHLGRFADKQVTHWQPLPEPPESE